MSRKPAQFLTFGPQECEHFMAHSADQFSKLQQMYRELRNAFMADQQKRYEILQGITGLRISLAGDLANLEKSVTKIIDGNAVLKKEADRIAIKKLADELAEDGDKLKRSLENLVPVASIAENGSGGAISAAAVNNGAPLNFPERFNNVKQCILSNDMKLTENSVRLTGLETTNYDGTIILKIEGFTRLKEEAKQGSASSILSQPFYTSRHGYKLCLRVYLNGDGMGMNTHVSLYLVLMKGDYDAFLPFPFKQKVTLYLLDQSSNRRHFMDEIQPDPTSSAFKKTDSDMNIASGCPMFVTHDMLDSSSYLVDDTIFIRAVVDTTNLEDF